MNPSLRFKKKKTTGGPNAHTKSLPWIKLAWNNLGVPSPVYLYWGDPGPNENREGDLDGPNVGAISFCTRRTRQINCSQTHIWQRWRKKSMEAFLRWSSFHSRIGVFQHVWN